MLRSLLCSLAHSAIWLALQLHPALHNEKEATNQLFIDRFHNSKMMGFFFLSKWENSFLPLKN